MEEAGFHEHGTMRREASRLEEERMVPEERWQEIHRMARDEKLPIAEIAPVRSRSQDRPPLPPFTYAWMAHSDRDYTINVACV